jgi:hypothetical protein
MFVNIVSGLLHGAAEDGRNRRRGQTAMHERLTKMEHENDGTDNTAKRTMRPGLPGFSDVDHGLGGREADPWGLAAVLGGSWGPRVAPAGGGYRSGRRRLPASQRTATGQKQGCHSTGIARKRASAVIHTPA